MENHEIEETIHLTDYYYMLVKHKWLILSCLIIIVSLTTFFTYQMKPVYQATATMVIDKEQIISPLTGEQMEYGTYVSESLTFNTHFKLITSRPVLEKVIRNLKLDQPGKEEELRVSPVKAFITKMKENIRQILKYEEKRLTPEDKQEQLIGKLRENITIKEIRDTRLLNISVQDYHPARAKDIANGLAKAYIEFNTESRLESSKRTMDWMEKEMYETKKKLEDAEKEFLDYKQDEKIFSIQGKQKVITQKIEDFNNAYLETRNKRLELDSKIAKLREILRKGGDILRARSLIDNPMIDTLYSQLLEAEVEFNRLNKVFKEKHPKIVQIQSKIEKTKKKLDEEVEKEMESIRTYRSVLYNKERILQKTIAGFENDALETNKKELQYIILQRNVDTNKKLYDTLFSKIEESNIEVSLDVQNIRIAEDAVTPIFPVKPNKKMNIMLSAILGLMMGVCLSFLREYMDRTIYTEEDVQKYLNLPVLSVIPEAELP